jgi:fibronectin-binding autotransporter adhesin
MPRIVSVPTVSAFPLFSVLVAMSVCLSPVSAQQFWNTNGLNATITSNNWGSSASGPFTNAYVPGTAMNFTANSSITNVTNTVVGNFVVADGVTVNWTPAGTMGTGGTVRSFTVGTGSVLDFVGQGFSTTAGTGFIKSGNGILFSSNGNTFSGGFTMNAGTMIVGGINAMGGGTTHTLTINGGTITANNTRDLSTKYGGGIIIGGDFTLGGVTTGVNSGNGTNTANLTFSNATSLGSAIRTINLGGTANYTFNGVVSGTGGITLTNSAGGGGRLTLGGANTYSGGTVISGGILNATNTTGSATGTGVVTVNGGSLTGSGIVSGPVTVASGGAIEGGNGTVGTLTVNNSVTVQSGGTLRAQLGAATADAVNLSGGSGVLSLASGSNLNLVASGFDASTTTYTLANLSGSGIQFGGTAVNDGQTIALFTSTGGNSGNVDIDPAFSGSTLNFGLSNFNLNSGDKLTLQRSGSNLTLVFTPVPEPGLMLAVCGLVVGGAVAVRKWRRKGADLTPAA